MYVLLILEKHVIQYIDRIIYKLKEFGVTGNILEITETMYATPKVSVLYEWKISQSFSTKMGLKQGDVLSALLFNLYT